jgi:hypothetical protein
MRTVAVLLTTTSGCSMLLVKGPDPKNTAAECTQESGVAIADLILAVFGAGAAVTGAVLLNAGSSAGKNCTDSCLFSGFGDSLAGISLLGIGGLMTVFHSISAGVGYGRVSACREAKGKAAPIALSFALFDYQGALAAPPSVSRTPDEAKKAAESALRNAKEGAALETLSASVTGRPMRTLSQWMMQRGFRQMIAHLLPGEASDILDTPFGYLIVRRAW